jgi:predicted amidophosphoribosyltransferase
VQQPIFDQAMDAVAQVIHAGGVFDGIFTEQSVLVPVPRSAPQLENSLWPGLAIAQALHSRGIGGAVLPMVARTRRITKSATASAGARPSPSEHAETMAVTIDMFFDRPIVLVDDIITKGATMLGASQAIHAVRADLAVCGFSLLRTLPYSETDAKDFASPAISVVRTGPYGAYRKEETYRSR